MNARLIGPIAIFVIFIVDLWLCNVLGFLGIVLLPPLLMCLLLINKPKGMLVVFWFTMLFLPSVEILMPTMLVKVVEQAIGLLLLVVLIGDSIINTRPSQDARVMSRMLFLLTVLVVISAVVNTVPVQPFVYFVLMYMKQFWVFFFALRFRISENPREVFWLSVLSFALQIPLNILAFMGVNPLPVILNRIEADFCVGTLGDSHEVAYFMCAFILLALAYMRELKSPAARLGVVVSIVVAAIQFYLCFALHAYPMLVGVVGFQIIFLSVRRWGWRTRLTLFTLLLGAIVGAEWLSGWSHFAAMWTTYYPHFRASVETLQHGTKMDAYREVFLNPGRYLPYPWLGGGPGNYTSTAAFLNMRPLALLPHMFDVYVAVDPNTVNLGSITSLTRTGMIALYGELGPAGLILFWGMYVYAMVRVWRLRVAGRYTEKYHRILAEAFVPMVLFYLMLNIIVDGVICYTLDFFLWIWAACLWNPPPAAEAPVAPDAVSVPVPIATPVRVLGGLR